MREAASIIIINGLLDKGAGIGIVKATPDNSGLLIGIKVVVLVDEGSAE